uniref:Uncharacterized protein n=1 Tax=Trypanosoma vivax (strain Y486) TaxID=1055687 RepID=G0TSB4_TRYVY|nr:hypothetical protein TVY486_0300340 [Trypanosoma vivax Y486]
MNVNTRRDDANMKRIRASVVVLEDADRDQGRLSELIMNILNCFKAFISCGPALWKGLRHRRICGQKERKRRKKKAGAFFVFVFSKLLKPVFFFFPFWRAFCHCCCVMWEPSCCTSLTEFYRSFFFCFFPPLAKSYI